MKKLLMMTTSDVVAAAVDSAPAMETVVDMVSACWPQTEEIDPSLIYE